LTFDHKVNPADSANFATESITLFAEFPRQCAILIQAAPPGALRASKQ
jgi:hypothetical protein